MICRRAVEGDAGTLHALLQQMAAELGRRVAGGAAELRVHGFGPEPRFRAVLAEEGDRTLGFVLFFPEYSSWRAEVGLYVQDLYVCPPARGRGVAQVLLAAAMADASDWAPGYVTLMVDHRNQAAQGWYAKQGFGLRERGDLLILQGAALDRLMQGAEQ